jgi:hypothetical protein
LLDADDAAEATPTDGASSWVAQAARDARQSTVDVSGSSAAAGIRQQSAADVGSDAMDMDVEFDAAPAGQLTAAAVEAALATNLAYEAALEAQIAAASEALERAAADLSDTSAAAGAASSDLQSSEVAVTAAASASAAAADAYARMEAAFGYDGQRDISAGTAAVTADVPDVELLADATDSDVIATDDVVDEDVDEAADEEEAEQHFVPGTDALPLHATEHLQQLLTWTEQLSGPLTPSQQALVQQLLHGSSKTSSSSSSSSSSSNDGGAVTVGVLDADQVTLLRQLLGLV